MGNRHALSAPFGLYRAGQGRAGQGRPGQGHFAVAVLNEKLFGIFAETIGRPDLARNPDFATDALRRRHEPALAEAIEAWAAELGAAEAVSRLNAAGVPASEIASIAEAWSSEQASARGLASPVAHPTLGALRTPEQPVHFSGVARAGRRAAPALNEHEAQILRELGGEDRT